MDDVQAACIDVRAAAVTGPTSPVGLLVQGPAVSVRADNTVAEAAIVMTTNDVSALLVEGGRAIVTERDLARGVAEGWSPDEPVESLATRHPIAVDPTLPVVKAAGLMLNEHVRHLVVELDDGLVGIVSLRDVVAVLLQTADPQLWLTSLRLAISAPASEVWIG